MKSIFYFLTLVFLLSMVFACQRKTVSETNSGSKSASTASNGDTSTITDSTDIIKAKIDSAGIYVESGQSKMYSGDNNGAIEEFNKAIKAYSKYADAYYWRAVVECNIDNISACCEDYLKAEKLGHASARQLIDKYCK